MAKNPTLPELLERWLDAPALKREDYMMARSIQLKTSKDAEALCAALTKTVAKRSTDRTRDLFRFLRGLIMQAAAPAAVKVLRQQAPAILRPGFSRALKAKGEARNSSEIVYLARLLTLLQDAETRALLPKLARDPDLADDYLWSTIFSDFSGAPPAVAREFAKTLSEPLPEAFARVAYLDFVNELCRQDVLKDHPFNCPEGIRSLTSYLARKKDDASYAVSAAMALAFMPETVRAKLFPRARKHPSIDVQLEAAWSDGHLAGAWGVDFLAEQTQNPAVAEKACAYLEMLGRADRVPAAALNQDFRATSEMSSWLSHPMEAGTPPDEIELLDTREMHWPPLDKTIQVWAFRFRWKRGAWDYGMVGSITFSLSDYPRNASPEDIYAKHCAWEMESQEMVQQAHAQRMKSGR